MWVDFTLLPHPCWYDSERTAFPASGGGGGGGCVGRGLGVLLGLRPFVQPRTANTEMASNARICICLGFALGTLLNYKKAA